MATHIPVEDYYPPGTEVFYRNGVATVTRGVIQKVLLNTSISKEGVTTVCSYRLDVTDHVKAGNQLFLTADSAFG